MKCRLFCPTCRETTECEIRIENETFPVLGIPIETESQGTYCKHCGQRVWNPEVDDENLKKAYEIYRSKREVLNVDNDKDNC